MNQLAGSMRVRIKGGERGGATRYVTLLNIPQIRDEEYVTRPCGHVKLSSASGVQMSSFIVIMNTVTPHWTIAPMRVASP